MENKNIAINKLVKTPSWISFMNKLELMASIVFVVGLILLILKPSKEESESLLTIGLSTLSIVYFFKGFIKIESDNKLFSSLFYKIYGWGLAISIVTILFVFQKWSFDYILMISISLIINLISLVLALRLIFENNYLEKFHLIRLIIIIGLLIYAYFGFIN